MINDIKKGIKLMRYGYGLKSIVAVSIIYIICGFLILGMLLFTPEDFKFATQGMMLFVAPIMLVQLIHSLNASKMTLSSPMRKQLQTLIPSTISCIGMLTIYIFFVLYSLLAMFINPGRIGVLCGDIAYAALGAALFIVYLSLAYKYMIVCSIAFITLYMAFCGGYVSMPEIEFLNNANIFTFICVAALGILFIIIFGFVGYLLTLLTYKTPMSKYSQNVYLRKELQ